MADLGVDDILVVGRGQGAGPRRGLERFFIPGKTPFMLEPKSPVLYYLQRLRDEAQSVSPTAPIARAARWTSRRTRSTSIEGVGPGRKRALLNAFGSARGVSKAAPADLIKVEGVSAQLAQRIHDYFNKG